MHVCAHIKVSVIDRDQTAAIIMLCLPGVGLYWASTDTRIAIDRAGHHNAFHMLNVIITSVRVHPQQQNLKMDALRCREVRSSVIAT